MNILNLKFVAEVGYELNSNDLIKISRKVGGRLGEALVAINYFLLNIIILTFYFDLTYDWLITIVIKMFCIKHVRFINVVFYLLVYMFSTVFTKANNIRHVDTTCILILSIFFLFILGQIVKNYRVFLGRKLPLPVLKLHTIIFVDVLLFAYCTHFHILPLTNEIHTESERFIVIMLSSFITFLVYMTTSIAVYIENINVEIDCLRNIEQSCFIVMIKLALCVTNLLTFLQILVATRNTIHFLVGVFRRDASSRRVVFFEISVIFGIVLVFSVISKNVIGLMVGLFFMVSGFVMFLMPSFLYWNLFKKRRRVCVVGVVVLNVLVAVFCIFLGLFKLYLVV